MTDYRRLHTPGATWFFTVNLADRQDNRLLVEHAPSLRAVLSRVKRDHPFRIEALVVLPDHLHTLWTLPPDDSDYATRWALIKAGFSRTIPPGERRSASRIARGERGIWQRRFWEHRIRDESDFERHADYIHWNPVKHAYVQRVADWPYSSFHRYVERGIYPPDWAGSTWEVADAGE